MNSRRTCIVLLFLLLSTCASMNEREKAILHFSGDSIGRYEGYLVRIDQYTTNGAQYHQKYYNHLIGIARVIMEEKKLPVVKNSIGFYFDKRENVKEKLYLGIDVRPAPDAALENYSYEGKSAAYLKRHLGDIMRVLQSCDTIFTEKEIVGIVIGFKWDGTARPEMISLWIDKTDALRYENGRLTLSELIVRNTITNTDGKIIRLAL